MPGGESRSSLLSVFQIVGCGYSKPQARLWKTDNNTNRGKQTMSDMTKGTNQFASPKEKGFFSTLASQWQLALMSVPIFLYVILFNYVPLWGWSNAFKDYGNRKLVARGITPWNGLENFKWLFSRPDFYQAIRNTLAMSLINLVFGTVAAIVLAVLLNEVRQRAFKRTV